jgi:hypothetical protein
MSYAKKPKVGQQTMKVREAVYDYIVAEAGKTTRTPPGMMEHMQKLHAAIKEIFGHDDIEMVVEKIRQWQKKAEGK